MVASLDGGTTVGSDCDSDTTKQPDSAVEWQSRIDRQKVAPIGELGWTKIGHQARSCDMPPQMRSRSLRFDEKRLWCPPPTITGCPVALSL